MTVFRLRLTTGLAFLTLALAACNTDTPTMPPSVTEETTSELSDGPHAAADRVLAQESTTINATGTAQITELDIGNTTDRGYSAPIRGAIITPTTFDKPAPVIVLSHLRAPNCGEHTFAFPCPAGEAEHRFDQGMYYLGEVLAEHGYATVIPDLGGIFSGADVESPYNQAEMWKQSVSALVEKLPKENIDRTNVGLFAHSRSGTLVDAAVDLFGERNLRSVYAYGPGYDTVDLATISPAPADIPYFSLVGDADIDVGPSANLWLGHYLDQERNHPALVAQAPGLGHMLINRNAADERIGCEEMECPDAAEHERILTESATQWFNATLLGETTTTLPISSDSELPESLAGTNVRWLAASPHAINRLGPEKLGDVCHHADPMNPEPLPDACPEPEVGVVQILTGVARIQESRADINVSGARLIALHVSPSGSYQTENTVTVTLTLDTGEVVPIQLDPHHPALRNRATEIENGTYTLGTIRIPLPQHVSEATIKQIEISAPNNPIEVRGIDFLGWLLLRN
ncbi:MAG: hypothetical protein Q4D85_10255 [Corynebacterium sp.]|uniref:alpha/beta hydrolase family protein n=1 Tax=Corynebacterium sp. TaxID=1720 RepID=UPI0026DCDE95|nr:hypothetical protein [Corynebacterium sp.]MDO5099126.1 hypothetical protein [Corynebacterium sp.]